MNEKLKFIEFLISVGALRFGDFTTKSGRQSPYFINTGEFRTGKAMLELARAYAQTFTQNFASQADNLYGPAYKGIPLCTATTMILSGEHNLDVSFTYNRKERKDLGEGGLIVGDTYSETKKIVIIEDVVTAGTSVRETMNLLKDIPQAQVVGLIVAVDRKEKLENGQSALAQIQEQWGIKTHSIIDIDDIIAYIENPENLRNLGQDDSLLQRIQAYRQKWGS